MQVSRASPHDWLWIPALLFAHLYAAGWLLRAYALVNPKWWQMFSVLYWIRRRRAKRRATMERKGLYDSLERAATLQPHYSLRSADTAWPDHHQLAPMVSDTLIQPPHKQHLHDYGTLSAGPGENGAFIAPDSPVRTDPVRRDAHWSVSHDSPGSAVYDNSQPGLMMPQLSEGSEAEGSTASAALARGEEQLLSMASDRGPAPPLLQLPGASLTRSGAIESASSGFQSCPSADATDHINVDLMPVSQAVPVKQLVRRMTTMRVPTLELVWENLSCTYNTAQGSRTVLSGVCGQLQQEQMLAVMGPSGAGKSTLLDILAMRKTTGNLGGYILANGQPRTEEFAAKMAYVPQEDNFLPTMTVAETMQFYAHLILSPNELSCSKWERCKEVLEFMGLDHAHHTLVGGQLPGGLSYRGLSGGERRRLNVAVAVLGAPSMLFLDEPTSGLDSFSANIVMQHMRTMCLAGHAVVCTIHQPRPSIWALFDKVLFLSKGLEVYFGRTEGILPFFCRELGYEYRPAQHGFVSDWVMDLINITFDKPHMQGMKTIETEEQLLVISDTFKQHYYQEYSHNLTIQRLRQAEHLPPLLVDNEAEAGATAVDIGSDDISRDQQRGRASMPAEAKMPAVTSAGQEGKLSPRKSFPNIASLLQYPGKRVRRGKASWLGEFSTLATREWVNVTRNPMDVAGRMLLFAWIALFVGLLFYKLPVSMEILLTRLNLLFVEMVVLILLPFVYMSVTSADKAYLLADSSSKLYHISSYYVAKAAMSIPFSFINAVIFSFIIYGLSGLKLDAGAIIGNAALSFVLYMIALQILSCATALTTNQDAAFALAIAWTAINILFSKMYLRYQDLQLRGLAFIQWISATSYSIDGYSALEMRKELLNCSTGFSLPVMDFIVPYLPTLPQLNISSVQDAIVNPGPGCSMPLKGPLAYFGMTHSYGPTLGFLVAYLAIIHIFTFATLKLLSSKEQR